MSHILFPVEKASSKLFKVSYKPTEIPRQLLYILRGATDAIYALELFLKLAFEPQSVAQDESLEHSGYLAFDAHVGDTACQLRACMLLEITKHYKESRSCASILAINTIILGLKNLVKATHRLLGGLLDLDWNTMRSGGLDALGVPKSGMTMEELLLKLQWIGIDERPCDYSSLSASSQESLVSNETDEFMTGSASSSVSSASDTSSDPLTERWNVSDWKMVIRLLVYSHILSKYKQLMASNGEYRESLRSEQAINVAKNLPMGDFGKQFVQPNRRAVEEEFLSLQRHLSDLSCHWLEATARKSWSSPTQLGSLLSATIRTSKKGITAASSYVGYLVLRSLWSEESTPVIIMTTRFCPKGFHTNYFRVSLDVSRPTHEFHAEDEVLPNIAWTLTRLAGQDLSHCYRLLEPHILISANSIEGSTADYLERLPSAHRHTERNCADNEEHCAHMLEVDQDQVVQAIFAQHRHFAFDMLGKEALIGEDRVISSLMDRHLPGISTAWEASRRDALKLGTGASLKLCMWQHIALESPARFLAKIEGLDRPWVISDPVSRA